MTRPLDEITAEITAAMANPPRYREWTLWDKLVHFVTGRVTERVYIDRMYRLAEDDHRRERLMVEYRHAQKKDPSTM